MNTITIEIPEGKKAEWVDGVLTLVDEQPKDITERIKTFEDARRWCVLNNFGYLEREREEGCRYPNTSPDIIAYLKLRIITCALNEGWEPTKEDLTSWWAFTDGNDLGSYISSDFIPGLFGRMLAFRTAGLAEYAAVQFRDIYIDFCGCKKGGEE